MSGGGGGGIQGPIKQLAGLSAMGAGVVLAPATGGLSLGLVPVGAATVRSGTRDVQSGNRQARNLADRLNAPLNQQPKAMPSVNQDNIQKARLGALQSLQNRSGRASTLLTSQGTGQNNTFG